MDLIALCRDCGQEIELPKAESPGIMARRIELDESGERVTRDRREKAFCEDCINEKWDQVGELLGFKPNG